ncbi:AAA family ATPase, putative [Plasmodium gaboni]|uniref:AAA family ATPase, putative n=1 Tax=Plasmodium gaboni TaxID=647221 RepID=A0ABY1UHU3_9APIC|nr:AAA family ATPase, putative [Plasmodium gaboni]
MMNSISSIEANEIIYNNLLEEEKDCFQDILINDIWDIYDYQEKQKKNELYKNNGNNKNFVNGSKQNEFCFFERSNIYSPEDNHNLERKKKEQVDLNDLIFCDVNNNIFENNEDDEIYNKVMDLLNESETSDVYEKIEENKNLPSGIKLVDIKNFMNFDPLFIKVYHEEYKNEKQNNIKEKPHISNSEKIESAFKIKYTEHVEKGSKLKKKYQIDSDLSRASKTDSYIQDSDDGIYNAKELKMKKKKKNYNLSDDENEDNNNNNNHHHHNSNTNISSKKQDAFSNAFDILVKRKNEKNEEAIKAFNYINDKKRNRDSIKHNNHIGDNKYDKKKNYKKSNDDTNGGGYDEIPEKYWSLIEQGIEVNVIRYALSMKMDSNEQVKESDIIGLYDIKKIIKDKIVNVILRPDLFTGLNRAAKGILLFGPPGTGKTMVAKWVASSCNCSFYNVNTSSLFSKYIGETEKIVTALFKCAEVDNPSILFFDEIDSLLGTRKKDEDDTTIRIKNQLLQMIDGINTKKDIIIVIIGATNRPDMIDDAALRRFNKRVYIPLPDFNARKEQIRYIISKHTHSGFQLTEEELDAISVKLENWNGSDIYHLCSKCYEYVYDDAVEQYNGIQNIPNASIFRAIKYNDFIKAMTQVNTSYKNVFDYDEWSKMHSSL